MWFEQLQNCMLAAPVVVQGAAAMQQLLVYCYLLVFAVL